MVMYRSVSRRIFEVFLYLGFTLLFTANKVASKVAGLGLW